MCVCAILPAKAVSEMTFIVLGGTLNLTHSLTNCSKIYVVVLNGVFCSSGYGAGAPPLYEAYKSLMDNAYHYALQNLLDSGTRTCKLILNSFTNQASEYQIELLIVHYITKGV